MQKELEEALTGDCPQLKEAYSYLNKKGLKDFHKFVSDIIKKGDKYAEGQKKQRKKRRKKVYAATERRKKINDKRTEAE